MTRIQITGNIPLNGEIRVQGSKNAALPLMAASVLHQGRTILHNCPQIADVESMSEILRELGCKVEREEHSLIIDAGKVTGFQISEKYATRLRASVILMGSLLCRCKNAELPYPGGCSIGLRPIDLHLYAMKQLGAEVFDDCRLVRLSGDRMKGGRITFSFPSVGATENAVLAAVMTQGTTHISGCAAEPEIRELCQFLNEKGARIKGIGSSELTICGVENLQDSEYTLMPDRIVAGTYLCAAVGTRGQVLLKDIIPEHLQSLTGLLRQTGAIVKNGSDWIWADGVRADKPLDKIETAPYPGFPTDLQSQLMAVLTKSQGTSHILESMFESRFLTAKELQKMGAKITIEHKTAAIMGVSKLDGAKVTARDLRGGAALVIAGLMAQGETVVDGCHFIDRGYEDICRDLCRLGARICRF